MWVAASGAMHVVAAAAAAGTAAVAVWSLWQVHCHPAATAAAAIEGERGRLEKF